MLSFEEPATAVSRFLRQAAKGDRPTDHLHLRYAVLPFMASLAGEVVDRPRRQKGRRPIRATRIPSPKPERRRRAKRNANDVLEDGPIAMPAYPSARIVADHQSLFELIRSKSGENGVPLPQRQQPTEDWVGGPKLPESKS